MRILLMKYIFDYSLLFVFWWLFSYDLAVLRDVVQKMASIEISEEITSDQLLAMCGSELLRQEVHN